MISKKATIDETAKLGHYVFIEDDVEIGFGTIIKNFVEIKEGAKIGRNCVISSLVVIEAGVEIKDNTGVEEFGHVKKNIGSGLYGGSPLKKLPWRQDVGKVDNPFC